MLIKMKSIDKLPKLINLLKRKQCSPTKISKELNSDKRTVDKMLEVTNKLSITSCKSIKIEGREYRSCGITPEFRKILGGKKNER